MPIVLAYAEPPAAIAPAPRPSVITNPDWLSLPTREEMMALYPKAAAANGVEGRATIGCSVSAQGLLVNCAVLVDDPPGAGFSAAALSMASSFRMRPMTRDGVPVEGGQVRIPIAFRLPREEPAPANAALPPLDRPHVIRPDWQHKPSAVEVARAYPRAASGEEGRAAIRCVVDARRRLSACVVVSETPEGKGFGAAALQLSALFKLAPVDADGASVEGRAITIPFRLFPPSR